MGKNYVYKTNKITTKKLVGLYDAHTNTINIDGENRKIIDELYDFDNLMIEIVLKEKEEIDLTNEQ